MRGHDIKDRIERKMKSRGLRSDEIDAFLRMVDRIDSRTSGYVALERTSRPNTDLIFDAKRLSPEIAELEERGKGLLSKSVVIKLNGGRSTSMGGLVPKGILAAKNGRCYLDIISGQIEAIRNRWNVDIPLALMNSFFTHAATMRIIGSYPVAPVTFMQHQVPRLYEDTLLPMDSEAEDDWAPPGHGDIYESLHRSGLLDRLLAEGKRWAFISNLDNLAACMEPWILGLIDKEGVDFLLEVTDRTPADRKGGTLVVIDGRLDLLEIAQVAPHEREDFMDIDRFKVFNTNNVWIDLEALSRSLKKKSLVLPLIQNHKAIDGRHIIQLETAMGAGIGHFPRARGLRVGRERFFPTKKVGDLFVLQSDACVLDSMDRLQSSPIRPRELPLRPSVSFDPGFLVYPHKMGERFEDPASISLVLAHTLEVSGQVFFERNITIEGQVAINAKDNELYTIQRGTVLKDGAYP
jgi:UTP--glucose-1-phosphate uridylyltransferase